jgi:hypothetical protein
VVAGSPGQGDVKPGDDSRSLGQPFPLLEHQKKEMECRDHPRIKSGDEHDGGEMIRILHL